MDHLIIELKISTKDGKNLPDEKSMEVDISEQRCRPGLKSSVFFFHGNTLKHYKYLTNQPHVVSRCSYVLLRVEEAQRELNQNPERKLGAEYFELGNSFTFVVS